jgi:hypothetical protein
MGEDDLMYNVFQDGKFNSKNMNDNFEKLKIKIKDSIVAQSQDVNEKVAEEFAEEAVIKLMKMAFKEEDVDVSVKIWLWKKQYKHIVYATVLGLIVSLILITFQ